MSITDAFRRPVNIMDYQSRLSERFPALRMRRNPASHGIELGFSVGTFIAMEYLLDEEQVERVLEVALERLQIEGIHALGLQPRMDAYDAELRRLRGEKVALGQSVAQKDGVIAILQARIEELENPDDDEADQ